MKPRTLFQITGLCFWLLLLSTAQAQNLYINEFVAKNVVSLVDPDEDFNDGDPQEDWIEIYNPGGEAVDIGGMYLTDDLTNLLLYRIPATQPAKTTIPPAGFLVLFADRETHQGVLHLDFKLSSGGEQIGLTAADGVTVLDSLTYKGQDADTSFGRTIDGGPVWRFFIEPTPNASNGTLKTANLFINEFLASNNASLVDPDEDATDGDPFDDWIEIYNPGSKAVDIGGMFISDNLSNPAQWQIPDSDPAATTIAGGGFLLLYADKEMHQGPLHVDIRLSGAGEQIVLSANDGITIIDSLTFNAQTADTSFGRTPDGGGEWAYFSEPTPGVSNSSTAVAENAGRSSSEDYHLSQNYPNPFNPATTISYRLARESQVQLKIYDVLGKEIATLIDELQMPGYFSVRWDGKLRSGLPANTGVYFYNIKAGEFVKMKKMLLIR